LRGFRSTDFAATERLSFPEILAKPAIVEFDQRQSSSDAGASLQKAAETRYGLIFSMSGGSRCSCHVTKAHH
jgi:hypothetical protein